MTQVATETVSVDQELSAVPECLSDPIFDLKQKLCVTPEEIPLEHTKCIAVRPGLICL